MPNRTSHQSYRSIDARKNTRRSLGSFEQEYDFGNDDNSVSVSDNDNDSGSESDNWESDASSDSDDDSSKNNADSSGSDNEYKRKWDNKNKEGDDSDDEDSDYDSDDDSQWKEDQKTKQKMIAIISTVVCVILLASGTALGVAMSKKGGDADVETQVDASLQSPAVTTSDAPSFEPTSVPTDPSILPATVSPTVEVTSTSTLTDETLCGGGNETSLGGSNETLCGNNDTSVSDAVDNFLADGNGLGDEFAIPSELWVTPNADTYVLLLPEGEVVVKEPGAPPEDFGTSPTLLVRSRNSVDGTVTSTIDTTLVKDFEDGNFTGSNSTVDEDGNEEDEFGVLPANASSYALLNFNMEEYPWYNNTNIDLLSYEPKVYLCLYQKTDSNEIDPWGNSRMNGTTGNFIKNMPAVCRVETTVGEDLTALEGKAPTGSDVKQIASDVANYSMPEDCMGELVEEEFLTPDVGLVCVDVSNLINDYPPFVEDPYADADDESSTVEDDEELTSELPVRHRYLRKKKKDKSKEETSSEKRNLQNDAENIVDRSNYKNLLFMVAYTEKGRDGTAEFYSRENDENRPALVWTLEKVTAAPSVSANPTAPTVSPGPTDLPTAEPQPSSNATLAPSIANTIELSNSTNEDDFDSNSTTPDQGVDEEESLGDGNVTVGEEDDALPGDGNSTLGDDEEFLGDGNTTVGGDDEEFLGDGNTTVGGDDEEFLGDGNTTVGGDDEEFLGDGNITVGGDDEEFLGDGNITVGGGDEEFLGDGNITVGGGDEEFLGDGNITVGAEDDVVLSEDGNVTVTAVDDEELLGNETTTLVATMDTYFSPSKGGQPELSGLDDTLLVQNGDPSYEKTNALVSFETNIDPLPNEARFCLEHVPMPTGTAERIFTYTTCIVPYIDDIETLTGTDISYAIPGSCVGEFAEFKVSPSTERICADVSSSFLQPGGFPEGTETKKILFMIANLEATGQEGDRFYSSSDPSERYPTLEFSSGVLVI